MCVFLHRLSTDGSLLIIGVQIDNGTTMKAIIVPAKRSNYYKKRLPEELWGLIVEQEPEEKPRKKTSNK